MRRAHLRRSNLPQRATSAGGPLPSPAYLRFPWTVDDRLPFRALGAGLLLGLAGDFGVAAGRSALLGPAPSDFPPRGVLRPSAFLPVSRPATGVIDAIDATAARTSVGRSTEWDRPSRRPVTRCVASPAGTTPVPVSSWVSNFTRRSVCGRRGCNNAAASVLERALRLSEDLLGAGDCFCSTGGGTGSAGGLSAGLGGGEGSFASISCRFLLMAANTEPRPMPPAGFAGTTEAAAAAAWDTQSCVAAPRGGKPCSLPLGPAAAVAARCAPRNSDPLESGIAMDVAAKLVPVVEGGPEASARNP
mmetsp:Transcript_63652/g.170538  ORF Transcript_63652/g.170538 Transcript_63652/m.170538 type:complete len:303 (+) Transcript_63652:340-1248(+)